MKQIILAIAIVVAYAFPSASRAQVVEAPGIRDAISSQFRAFLDRDVTAAWSFASPGIQRIYRSPQNFGVMVEEGYPMVWTPTDTQFLDLREEGGALWQQVMVRDAAGVYHVLDYKMVQIDGHWLIDGVMFLRQAGVGV